MQTLPSKRGFTLIEILVAISIIAVLSVVVFASLEESRKKARDTERISELQELAAAISVYGASYGAYPNSLNDLVTAGLFTTVPEDPINEDSYVYTYQNNNNCFSLSGTREMNEEPLEVGNCVE